MSTQTFELPPVELPFEPPTLDSGVHARGGLTADAGVTHTVPGTAGSDSGPTVITWIYTESDWEYDPEMASSIINLLPIIGQVKGLIEAFTGEDLMSGRHLAWWERVLNVASVIPGAHEAKGLGKALGEIGHTAHGVNLGVHAQHLGHTITD